MQPSASDGADMFQEDEVADVVGEIGHADLHLGALDPDGADEEPHSRFLVGEYMLYAGTDHGLSCIGTPGRRRHFPMRRLLVADL